jgi:hypothetical protein
MIHRQRHVGGPGLADRLAVVDCLDEGQGLEIGLDPVGDPVQDVGPVGG